MKTIPRIIEEQVQRWQIMQKEGKEEKEGVSIVTVSREPGSGGRIVAAKLAEKLGIDIFHQEVINEMAKSGVVIFKTRFHRSGNETGIWRHLKRVSRSDNLF
jgi:hypothetical protein